MNTAEFFNAHFGRHLIAQTGDAVLDAARALSGGHVMAKGGAPQRIASGWAVITPRGSTLQFKLASGGLQYSDKTRYEAWADALKDFRRGDEILLLQFDKKPVPVAHLHRTYDLRAVHLCGPTGVDIIDITQEPVKESSVPHKKLWEALHAR